MSDLVSVDPYGSVYEFKGLDDPDFRPSYRVYPKWQIDAVNDLVHRAHGADMVRTEKDWNLIAGIVVFFIQTYPNEWEEFREAIPDIRSTRRSGGYSKSREIVYLAALPFRLERLIKACFPHQQFDKDFMYNFVKRFKIFRVGGA